MQQFCCYSITSSASDGETPGLAVFLQKSVHDDHRLPMARMCGTRICLRVVGIGLPASHCGYDISKHET
jgi:hypothetical protein